MKLKRLCIVVMAVLSVATVQGQDKMFEKFLNNKYITTVSISAELLSLVPDKSVNIGVGIKGLADKLEHLDIYTSGNKEAMEMMVSEFQTIRNDKSFVSLMSAKEQSQAVVFYVRKDNDGRYKDLVMFVDKPDECVVMRMVGNFSDEDISVMMNAPGNK